MNAGDDAMNAPAQCGNCRVELETGFLLDRAHYNQGTAGAWVAGQPKRSFWRGLALSDRQILRVAAMRCPRCGKLELYATEPTNAIDSSGA